MESGIACGIGPPMTNERYNWIQFSSHLLLSLYDAKKEKNLEDSYNHGEVEKFLGCLESICDNKIACGEIHNHISFYDIHSKLAKYLADKNKLPTEDPYRKIKHWDSKELGKLLGDLKNCCENILRKPEERQIFGHEAQVFEQVVKYFEQQPHSETDYSFWKRF